MRERLQQLEGQRVRVQGTFVRYGVRPKFQPLERTLVLNGIRDAETDLVLSDHLWFRFTKAFEQLGELEQGMRLELEGTVTQYQREPYRGTRRVTRVPESLLDYRISRPGNIVIVRR